MHSIINFDKELFEWLILYANPAWLTNLSEYLGKVSLFVMISLPFIIRGLIKSPRKTILYFFYILIFLTLSELTVSLLKGLFMRPRPGMQMGIYADPKGYSFPSAHSFNIAALATLISFKFPQYRFMAFFSAITVGLSRIFSNNHFLLDVFFGLIFGYVFTKAVLYIFKRLKKLGPFNFSP